MKFVGEILTSLPKHFRDTGEGRAASSEFIVGSAASFVLESCRYARNVV